MQQIDSWPITAIHNTESLHTVDEVGAENRLTPEEIKERKERCESIKWTIVGENVRIIWHNGSDPRRQGWFWDFSDGGLGKVFGDERDISEKPPGYAEAVSAHEFSHVEIDFPLEVFTKEELNTYGFLMGYNWADDNAVEYFAMQAHNSGREWIKVKAHVSMSPGGGLDHKQKATIKGKLGYIPKQHLFGGMTRQFFYKKEVTGELNIDGEIGPHAQLDPDKMAEFMADDSFPEDVRKAFKVCYDQGAIEEIYREIPSPLSEEKVCLAVAHRRAEVYRQRFWPEYKKLVEESQADQNLIEFLKKLIKGAANGKGLQGETGGEPIVIDLSRFPREIQEEIKKAIEKITGQNQSGDQGQEQDRSDAQGSNQGEAQGGAGSPGSGSQPAGESGDAEQSAPTNAAESTESSHSPRSNQGTPEDDSESTSDGTVGEESTGGVNTSPIDDLSEEAKEAVKQAYDALTEKERNEIEQTAREAMGEVDDELNEEMQGKTNKKGKRVSTKFGKDKMDSSKSIDESSDDGEDSSPSDGSSDGQDSPEGESSSSSGSAPSGSGELSEQSEANEPKDTHEDHAPKSPQTPPPPPPEYRPVTIDPHELEQEIKRTMEALKSEPTYVAPEGYSGMLTEDLRQEYLKKCNTFLAENPQIQDWADILTEELFQQLRPDRQPKKIITTSPSHAKIKIKEYLNEWVITGRSLKWYEKEVSPERFTVGITYLVDLSASVLSIVENLLPPEVKIQYARKGWRYLSKWLDSSETQKISASILGAQLQLVIAAMTAQLELHIPTQLEGYPVGPQTSQPFITTEEFQEVLGDDRLTPEMQASIWGMVEESGGGTPTSQALLQSYKNIKARFENDPKDVQEVEFIVVLTDGQPDGGPGEVRAAQEAICKDAEETGLKVAILLIGIGPSTEFVNGLSPKMPEEIFDLVQDKLIEIRGVDVSDDEVGYSFKNPAEAAAVYPLILGALLKNPNIFREEDVDEN